MEKRQARLPSIVRVGGGLTRDKAVRNLAFSYSFGHLRLVMKSTGALQESMRSTIDEECVAVSSGSNCSLSESAHSS